MSAGLNAANPGNCLSGEISRGSLRSAHPKEYTVNTRVPMSGCTRRALNLPSRMKVRNPAGTLLAQSSVADCSYSLEDRVMKQLSCLIMLCCAQIVEAQEVSHQHLMRFRGENGEIQSVQSPDDWEQRRIAIINGMQQAMGNLPERATDVPFDVKVVEQLAGDGFKRQTLTFASADGDRIPLDLYLPDPLPKEKAAAMLALHPTGKLGKRIVAGESSRQNRQYAVELAQRGYVVIAPDYPSFGDYAYDFAADDYVSGTMKGIANHIRLC